MESISGFKDIWIYGQVPTHTIYMYIYICIYIDPWSTEPRPYVYSDIDRLMLIKLQWKALRESPHWQGYQRPPHRMSTHLDVDHQVRNPQAPAQC